MLGYLDIFFLQNIARYTLSRKKKENAPGTMDHFSGKFLYGHVECEKLITILIDAFD